MPFFAWTTRNTPNARWHRAVSAVLLVAAPLGCSSSKPNTRAVNATAPSSPDPRMGLYGKLVLAIEPRRQDLQLANQGSFIGLLTSLDQFSGKQLPGYTLRVGSAEWKDVSLGDAKLMVGGPIAALSGHVHLVRVTVAERESGADVKLRVRDVVRIDGTSEAPFNVASVFDGFFEPYLESTSMEKESLSDQLARALEGVHFESVVDGRGATIPEARVMRPDKDAGPPSTYEPGTLSGSFDEMRYWASWLPQKRSLYMVVWMSRMQQWKRTVPNPRAGVFGCEAPPGADCAPYRQPETIDQGRAFRAEVAVVGTYTHGDGKTRIETFPAEMHEQF